MDALQLAKQEKDREVVFFATGFETTSPLIAGTIAHAEQMGVKNFSIYVSHKLVPPALKALLDSSGCPGRRVHPSRPCEHDHRQKTLRIRGKQYKKPSVITGFEAKEIIEGILMIVRQIAQKRAEVEIQYRTVVRDEGNPRAVALLDTVFRTC